MTRLEEHMGHVIRERREDAGLMQEDVAVAARVSVDTVRRVENAKTHMDVDRLLRIARAVGIPLLSDLFRVAEGRTALDLAAITAPDEPDEAVRLG